MPGPIAQTAALESPRACPAESRGGRHRLHVSVVARRDRDCDLEQATLLELTDRVREREGQRAAGQLDVGDPGGREGRADRGELAVQRAAHDRHPGEVVRERPFLLDVSHGRLHRRVREDHHMGPLGRRETEPTGQVRVEHVESA